jgi:hypothetical protein
MATSQSCTRRTIGFEYLATLNVLVSLIDALTFSWIINQRSPNLGELLGIAGIPTCLVLASSYWVSRRPQELTSYLWPAAWGSIMFGAAIHGALRNAGVNAPTPLLFGWCVSSAASPYILALLVLWRHTPPQQDQADNIGPEVDKGIDAQSAPLFAPPKDRCRRCRGPLPEHAPFCMKCGAMAPTN